MFYQFYRSYRFTAAVKFFLFRRILPAGWGVLIAMSIAATMLMGSPIRPLYQVFAMTLSLAALGLLWAWARRGKLEAKRQVPPYASVGQTLSYQVQIANPGADLRDCQFEESVPDPRPSWEHFALSKEPGEHMRNAFDRYFAFNRWQWLLEKNLVFRGGKSSAALALPARGIKSVSMQLTPLRRGMIELQDMRVLLPDPFHFFQRARKVRTGTDHIAVLPRRYRLPAVRLPGLAQFQAGDDAASRQNGSSGEFTSLREYRPGDPPRMIHWRSWAKTGRPIVKEVEDVYFPRYALVLDTFCGENDAIFEEAVSVAASFVSEIDTSQVMLDLMFLGDCDHVISAGKGLADSVKLLEALAVVESSFEENFEQLSRLIHRHRGDLSACICVFAGWSQSRANFLHGLEASGIQVIALAVVPDDAQSELPGRVLRVRVNHPQEDLMQLR